MTERQVIGRFYRILTNVNNDIWDRLSFWKKASDVELNDGSTLENNKPLDMLHRSAYYSVGAVAYIPTAPSWVMLKCVTAGTTAAVAPTTYGTIASYGITITDGTARFVVYDKRPNSSLTNSDYQMPTMNLVNDINSQLIANGQHFYFDYKNGKYGFNTDANRGSGTFVAF